MRHLTDIIASGDEAIRDLSLDDACRGATAPELLDEARRLEAFRHASDNLYHCVRACLFLYAIHRYHLPGLPGVAPLGHVPMDGYLRFLDRRFEEAVAVYLGAQADTGPNDAISSALAVAYHRLAFQTLTDQVRRSVRSARGNQWMFRMGHPLDQPLRVRRELFRRQGPGGAFPLLRESTPVRMDLTHSGWSDIFFLGMDYPEGARVLNVSIDLAVRGRDPEPQPPVRAYLRVIDEPLVRLGSVDLGVTAEITELSEIFDFARDYLGLLKAALIASGLIPPGIEGSEQRLGDLLEVLLGPGHGLELVSHVAGIPKGSRLAVSTNLLASLITAAMRATGQTEALEGGLTETERRVVASRAILGEWLAGSGGGWQDSGGVWPGIKIIQGAPASPGDPEFGVSRGRLLPSHRVLDGAEVSPEARQRLQDSLVLVHGGMAQNVGPILEMVTEKYLLRSGPEWRARQDAHGIFDEILSCLRRGDIGCLGDATTRNFAGPIQAIIPWVSNLFTETLIERTRERFGRDFWGFWMLGGMSGGGMGFMFRPECKERAEGELQEIMSRTRLELQHALPFAMEPVVYRFAINEFGTRARLLTGTDALMPAGYYAVTLPALVRLEPGKLPDARRAELDAFGNACRTEPALAGTVQLLFDRLLPKLGDLGAGAAGLRKLQEENGFDPVEHEQIRADLRAGRIGLAQNRLPVNVSIRDVRPDDVLDARTGLTEEMRAAGMEALASGQVAVLSLAAGVGSRWTQGAGVVKALNPFARLGGRYRGFLETHLAKSRRVGLACGTPLAHIVATSYLTHDPIAEYVADDARRAFGVPVYLSPGRSIGMRLVPMERDLRYAWEETPQQVHDDRVQRMVERQHASTIEWARKLGEGTDYTDNTPSQCLNPVGHWYEMGNLIKNGTLRTLLRDRPALRYLMLHNIDTLGADADPAVLGWHIGHGAALSFEVVPRRVEDRGGGLARVDGRLRLVEGLAMPREECEFALSYYNSMTTWIDLDAFLALLGLGRDLLDDEPAVETAVRRLAARMPTYVTLKSVKKRWGHGHEDVFTVAQYEKLWGDMTALDDVDCRYIAVPRFRGLQLKDQAQLDGWLRDGSAAYVERLCGWL